MDSVLELSVPRIWLKRVEDQEGDMNPPMVLSLVVRARLVRGTEKTVWYDHTFVHDTEKRPYAYWQPFYNPLYGFQTDLEKANQHLAEQIIEKLFLLTPTTSPATSDTSTFSPWQPNGSSFDYSAVHRASC